MILASASLIAGAIVLSAIINQKGLHRMSQATDRLAASIQAATASTDALVARVHTIPVPTLDETPIVAAADAVDALKAKLDATLPGQQQ